MQNQTKIAVAIIVTSVVVLALVVHLVSLDENDWIGIMQNQHPPTVDIAREGSVIWIRWYGGWDQQFIDHVRVCTSVAPCQDYVKPRPGHYIKIGVVGQENVTVDVYGWDEAVREYRIIASETV